MYIIINNKFYLDIIKLSYNKGVDIKYTKYKFHKYLILTYKLLVLNDFKSGAPKGTPTGAPKGAPTGEPKGAPKACPRARAWADS